jgi:hypothetical protein
LVLVPMTVGFSSPNGAVSEIEFEREAVGSTAAGRCLRSSFERLTVPRFSGDTVRLRIRVLLAVGRAR